MIDTHSHIYCEEFDNDREQTVLRAVEHGVVQFVLPAVDKTSHKKLFEVAEQFPNHYPTIGVHPTSIKEDFEDELNIAYEILHSERDRIVAIGEIGLDYYWDKIFIKEQERALRKQLEWAIEENLPAIIHTRSAYEEMIDVLRDYRGSSLRTIFHCYSGTVAEAETILSCGEHLLGIGGVVTFKKSALGDIVKEVGLKNIVLETDAPYLAPSPHRGKRNESSYLPFVVKTIAQLLDKEEKEIDEVTTNNAKKIFNI